MMSASVREEGLHFYLPSFAGGGAERIFIRLANHIAAQGRPVHFVVNHAGGPLRDMLSTDVNLHVLGTPRAPRSVLALASHLRARRPTVLISAMTRTNIVALLAARLAGSRTRVIVCERNQFSTFIEVFDPLRKFFVVKLVRSLYPRAHAVIGNTREVTRDIAQVARLDACRTFTINNPAPETALMLAARAEEPDHPWLRDKVPFAIAIGRLVPQKDYCTMLRAVSLAGSDLRLLVLGDGPDRTALEAEAQSLGLADRVAFLGYRMDRFAYLVRASVFLLSSRTEGFPNALIEAIAAGIPAISTDCAGGGAREIIGAEFPDRIVPVGDAKAMAAAIVRVLAGKSDADREADEMRADNITRRYRIDTIADKFVAMAAT